MYKIDFIFKGVKGPWPIHWDATFRSISYSNKVGNFWKSDKWEWKAITRNM